MLTPATLVALVFLLSILIYKYLIYPIFLSPLSKIPAAHPLCTFSERWLQWQQKHERESKSLYAAHEQHGPIVRIGPKEVSVNSLEGLRRIYTAGLEKHATFYEKFTNFGTSNLVSTVEHFPHSHQKRMISSVYAKSYIQRSGDVATLSNEILFERFLPLLRQYADQGEGINTLDLFQWAGIDFSSAYIFGTGLSTDFCRDTVGREAYFTEMERIRKNAFVGEKNHVEGVCMGMLEKLVGGQSEESKAEGTSAVVAALLHSQLVQKGGIADKEPLTSDAVTKRCASELLDHMVATHETFAIILTYAVHRLSQDASIQDALRAELRTLDPMVREQSSEQGLPPPDKIDNLPLLHAVLMETLRLHAPTPGRLPRVAPAPNGIILHDYHIPPGTTVSCNGYSLHRTKEAFPKPFEWLPQRWLAGEEREALGKDFPPLEVTRRWMWAFGSGGRMCIGSNFALQGSSCGRILLQD